MQIQLLPLSISELSNIISVGMDMFEPVRYVWNKYIYQESLSATAWMNAAMVFFKPCEFLGNRTFSFLSNEASEIYANV